MEQYDARNWTEFETWVHGVEGAFRVLNPNASPPHNELMFRGQTDDSWGLRSTLEREYPEILFVADYYKRAYRSRLAIGAHTGHVWSIPAPQDFEKLFDGQPTFPIWQFPGAEYLIYLRHHGFPSPFLDWTRSPYVAAQFAVSGSPHPTRRIAIFAYSEWVQNGRGQATAMPGLYRHYRDVPTHRRHFLQQCSYTVCARETANGWVFDRHEAAFEVNRNHDRNQDVLWKFTLPADQGRDLQRHLDRSNMNAYTLMASEESLMNTLAFRYLSGPVPPVI